MSKLAVEELRERLKSASKDLRQVFGEAFTGLLLFGSYPRGEASEESDVDVLVVIRGLSGLGVRGRSTASWPNMWGSPSL